MADQAPTGTRVYAVPPGSIVVFPHWVDTADLDQIRRAIADACGHEQFVIILEPPGGGTEVFAAPEVIESLRAEGLIGEAVSDES